MTDERPRTSKKFWIGLAIFSVPVILAALTYPRLLTPKPPSIQSQNRNHVRLVILAIKSYASDHDGRHPPVDAESGTLSVLIADRYLDEDRSLYWIHPETGEKIPWLYHPGLSNASYSRTPLIAQPVPTGERRIIGYSGGQVITERDDPNVPFRWPPPPAEPPPGDP